MSSKNTSVKISIILLTIILFTISCGNTSNKDAINPVLMKTASELNKSCPIFVDAETRLDSALALPGNVFNYRYTLINFENSTIDTNQVKQFLIPTMKNAIKTNPQMQGMRDIGCTFLYSYSDKTGAYAFSIYITPDDYK